MDVKIIQEIDAPLEVTLRAKDERYNHLDKIEGLKKLDYKSVKEDDAKITTTRDFEISMDKTPPPIRKMIPEELFKFVEEGTWHKKENKQEWEMVSAAKGKITWKGVTTYKSKGDSTEREILCTIKVKVPFIGDGIEKQMAAGFKKSQEKDLKTLVAMTQLIKDGKA